jgi:hypothetical protein
MTRTRTGVRISKPAALSQSPRICSQGTRRERRGVPSSPGGYSYDWVPTVSGRSALLLLFSRYFRNSHSSSEITRLTSTMVAVFFKIVVAFSVLKPLAAAAPG